MMVLSSMLRVSQREQSRAGIFFIPIPILWVSIYSQRCSPSIQMTDTQLKNASNTLTLRDFIILKMNQHVPNPLIGHGMIFCSQKKNSRAWFMMRLYPIKRSSHTKISYKMLLIELYNQPLPFQNLYYN